MKNILFIGAALSIGYFIMKVTPKKEAATTDEPAGKSVQVTNKGTNKPNRPTQPQPNRPTPKQRPGLNNKFFKRSPSAPAASSASGAELMGLYGTY